MRSVRLVLPEGRLRRWHADLAKRLAADGAYVSVELATAPAATSGLALVEQFERLLYERGAVSLSDPVATGEWLRISDAPADLAFDLTGAAQPAADAIFPLYDGAPGEDARDAALLDGRAPRLQLARDAGDGPVVVADALPGHERPWIYSRGRDAVASRLALLIRDCVRRGGAPIGAPRPMPMASGHAPAAFFAASLAARVGARLNRLVTLDEHWRIGWRTCAPGDGVMERLAWPKANWTWLEDDRRRYFADPFLFEHGGVVHLFCEEFPYETGKGVISVVTLDAQGRASAPRVVLERPYHLSYPLVFRHEGQIWMMPESSANRTLELYRAESFPDRWVRDRTLLEGLEIADATFFESGGRHWLTGVTIEGGSSWDCLSLFTGPGPLGPWTRCGDGPVLIDASAARPAGLIETRNGELWRPAQDCTRSYGGGLALCRIDRLDEDGFAQTVGARLAPPAGAPGDGVHTLNRSHGFETIDAVGPRSKFAGGA